MLLISLIALEELSVDNVKEGAVGLIVLLESRLVLEELSTKDVEKLTVDDVDEGSAKPAVLLSSELTLDEL